MRKTATIVRERCDTHIPPWNFRGAKNREHGLKTIGRWSRFGTFGKALPFRRSDFTPALHTLQ